MPERALRGVLCALLGAMWTTVAGCGSSDASTSAQEAELVPQDTTRLPQDAVQGPFDPRFDVFDEYAPQCGQMCAENASPRTSFCPPTDQAGCAADCKVQLQNVDEACAECVLARAAFSPGGTSCNEWECQCAGPSYSFSKDGCTSECAASLEHQAELRKRAERPLPSGTWPDEELAVASGVAQIEPSPEGLFLLEPSSLSHVNREGATEWRRALEPGIAWPYDSVPFVALGGHAFVALGRPGVWASYNATGETVPAGQVPYRGAPVATREPTTQVYRMYGPGFGLSTVDTQTGDLMELELEGFPSPTSGRTAVGLIEALAEGTYAVAVSGYDEAGDRRQQLLRVAPDADNPSLLVEISEAVELDPDLALAALRVATDGALWIAGTQETKVGDERLKLPVAGRLEAGGQRFDRWAPLAPSATASNLRLLPIDDGRVVLVSTESPRESFYGVRTPSPQAPQLRAGECVTYGCQGAVVRVIDTSGEPQVLFDDRSRTTAALDAAVVQGQLFVLTRTFEETTQMSLMVFNL